MDLANVLEQIDYPIMSPIRDEPPVDKPLPESQTKITLKMQEDKQRVLGDPIKETQVKKTPVVQEKRPIEEPQSTTIAAVTIEVEKEKPVQKPLPKNISPPRRVDKAVGSSNVFSID